MIIFAACAMFTLAVLVYVFWVPGQLEASEEKTRLSYLRERKDVVYEKEQYPEDVTEPEIELNAAPATRAHMRNWLAAVESRGRPIADIEEGHISTASCILANVSMQLGRPLTYDPAKRQVVADEHATALLRRQFRSPWQHPADGLA